MVADRDGDIVQAATIQRREQRLEPGGMFKQDGKLGHSLPSGEVRGPSTWASGS